MKRTCCICHSPLKGADLTTHSEYCWKCASTPAVALIEKKYEIRNAKLRLDSAKRLWLQEIPKPTTLYRVYYKDYGTDCISYYTDLINTLPEANVIKAAKIANGVDVVAKIVEEKTTHREIHYEQ